MAPPALAVGTSLVQSVRRAILQITDTPPYCAVCFHVASEKILERFNSYNFHECTGCALQFWDPREMLGAHWYSAMYGPAIGGSFRSNRAIVFSWPTNWLPAVAAFSM